MSKNPASQKSIDILGNTWTARHLARYLQAIPTKPYHLRLWNDTPPTLSPNVTNELLPKMMLVPNFLKDHKGLGFRTIVETTIIHHHRRKRDLWTSPVDTAKNLDCCPEVLALLYDLIFLNSYGATVLTGERLKNVNFDWQKRYESARLGSYTPTTTVLASKSSIERVWDNSLEHDGAILNFNVPVSVESIRKPTTSAGLALILSAPHGIQDDTDYIVRTHLTSQTPWIWKSYQCVVNRELVASLPKFFVWIDIDRGEDFLSNGLLYDGSLLRVIAVPLPHSDDKILVQVDRLTDSSLKTSINAQEFFVGSPWYALRDQTWNELALNNPDDAIYGAKGNPESIIKKLTKKPISVVAISASGLDHHVMV